METEMKEERNKQTDWAVNREPGSSQSEANGGVRGVSGVHTA